jgi:hypothetical protein
MSGRPLATAAEQTEVVRLRADGYSHRAIAAAVFGSEGLKGRWLRRRASTTRFARSWAKPSPTRSRLHVRSNRLRPKRRGSEVASSQ